MTNLAGEKFDITKTGTHNALQIPQGSRGADIQLQLQVNVHQVQGDCDGLFATQVMVSGHLIGFAEKIVFEADKSFSVSVGRDLMSHKVGTLWTLVHAQVPPTGWPSHEPFDTTMKAGAAFNGRPYFEISLGAVSISVEKVGHARFNFLNVDVKGVSKLTLPIGGILGFDSHEDISIPLPHCTNHRAKLLQVQEETDGHLIRAV